MPAYALVTRSRNKRLEIERILGEPVDQIEIELPELQAVRVEEVVAHKAEYAYRAAGERPVMIEDTGLYVHAWNGLPGALVKWFDERVGSDGLCRMLQGYTDRTATAQTIIATFDGQLRLFSGEVEGTIAPEPRGSDGFGWDNVFVPLGETQTFAQMGGAAKDRFSMRRKAVEELQTYLLSIRSS